MRTFIQRSLIALAGALILSTPTYAQTPKQIDVPAGDLVQALEALAKQAQVNLVYQAGQMQGLKTQGVSGAFTPREAVVKLLEGTSLRLNTDAATGAMMISSGTAPTKTSANDPHTATTDLRLAESATAQSQSSSESTATTNLNPQESGASSDASNKAIEEIVVTAQKRQERLQDVPISISVLSGRDLDHSNLSLAETLQTVPGVQIRESVQAGGTIVTIRGTPVAGATGNGSSPVAYYLDTVPFGFVRHAISPDANVYDLDRVEVLRGPQGTLYGANTLNGVVRILTKDADPSTFEFKSRATLTSVKDGDAGYRADAAINVPLMEDRLAVRAVVGYQDAGGWVDTPVKPDHNDAKIRNYRLKVGGQLTEELSVGLSYWRFDGDLGGYNTSDENRTTNTIADTSSDSRYDVYGAKLEYQFPAVTITSLTSYIDYGNSGALDVSGGTSTSILVDSDFSSETLSEELLVSSNNLGPWRWSAGFFYRDSKDFSGFDLAFLSPQPTAFTDKSESYAFFGEISRKFLDDTLELTAGARRFHDTVDGISNSTFFGTPPQPQSFTFNATTPRALLTWKPQENRTFYASYSEGFRSGLGQNTFALAAVPDLPPVRPDKLYNYEVGAKGSVLDGRLAYESSLYFEDWKNSQQVLIILIQPNVGIPQLVNSESVSGWGADFALTTQPVPGLKLAATYAWNDLSFDEDVFSGGNLLFTKGSRPSSSAKYTAGASADYSRDLGVSGLVGVLSVSGNYTSKLQNTFLVGPNRQITSGDNQLFARASFSVESPRGWRGSLFVDNLTDEGGLITPGNPPLLGMGSRPRPRTYGVQLEYRFGRE